MIWGDLKRLIRKSKGYIFPANHGIEFTVLHHANPRLNDSVGQALIL